MCIQWTCKKRQLRAEVGVLTVAAFMGIECCSVQTYAILLKRIGLKCRTYWQYTDCLSLISVMDLLVVKD
jgi:hypothetical protein